MSPVRMSRIENTVRVALEFNEAFNRHDLAGMMKLISDNCVFESVDGPDGKVFTGKEEIAEFWQAYMSKKPGLQIHGEDVFGLGFRTIFRWRAEWENAEGEKRHVRGVDIFHVKNGLIEKQYAYAKGQLE